MRAAVEPPVEPRVKHALARASVYRLLGRAFGYPTPAVLAELTELAARSADAAPVAAEPLHRLAAALRCVDAATAADEYVFLFDRQVRCPPYESAYGPVPQMAGKSAQLADVAGFYTAFGLAAAAGQPDIEDHVAAELEFMSALALKEAYAEAEGEAEGLAVVRSAQVAFFTDHLGRWGEAFARSVGEATPLPYYTAAAELLEAWIVCEREALGVRPVPLGDAAALGPLEDETFSCPMAGSPIDE